LNKKLPDFSKECISAITLNKKNALASVFI